MPEAYVGRCANCREVVAATVITDERDRLAETVAEWLQDDLRVEIMTVEQAREAFTLCECISPAKLRGQSST